MVSAEVLMVVAGILVYVFKFLNPNLAVDATQIFNFLVLLLGLFGVVVQFRFRKLLSLGVDAWLKSKALWLALISAANIALHIWKPDFPFTEVELGVLIFWFLAQIGVNPEIRETLLRHGIKI